MIKLIIFDVGGILVPESGDEIMKRVAQSQGLSESQLCSSWEENKNPITEGKITLADWYTQVAQQFKLPSSPQDILSQHLNSYLETTPSVDLRVVGWIGQLRKNYSVVCLTNTEQEIGNLNRGRKLFAPFERAYLSTEMQTRKPLPRAYTTVLEDYAVSPAESIFLDDREAYVKGAREIGMHAVHYRNLNQAESELSSIVLGTNF